MAHLELLGEDDDFLDESFDVDCPFCGKSFTASLDQEKNFIICPHCNSKIELEFS